MLSFARNPSELVYRPPLLTRAAAAVVAVLVLVFLLAMWPQVLDAALPTSAMLILGVVWLALIAGCVRMALGVRIAFVFGTDGVVSREWWGTRRLAYAAIAGCTVDREEQKHGRGPTVRGYRLAFQAMRPGLAPLQLFIQDGLPLDTAIVRRLKTVPGLSRRQLKILEMATLDHLHSDRLPQAPASEA